MNPYTQCALLSASTLRMLPHILLYLRFKKTIDADLEPYGEGKGSILTFIKVCTRQKVFRNLFYYRLGEYRSVFIKWLMPEDKSLHITCPLIGEGCHLEHTYSTYLNADSIGRNFYCLHLVTLGNGKDGRPTIGDNVLIGPNCQIYTPQHPMDYVARRQSVEAALPVTIGDDTWLCGSVVVCPGVTIGKRCIIAAGSVVTKDIPDDSLAAGNPAVVKRRPVVNK